MRIKKKKERIPKGISGKGPQCRHSPQGGPPINAAGINAGLLPSGVHHCSQLASILPLPTLTEVRGAIKKATFSSPSMAGGGGGADDDVVEVTCGGGGGGGGRDPGAYAAVLKRRLDLYCAAVAKSMVRFLLLC
jgi:hypothetical protein